VTRENPRSQTLLQITRLPDPALGELLATIKPSHRFFGNSNVTQRRVISRWPIQYSKGSGTREWKDLGRTYMTEQQRMAPDRPAVELY
jgi:hypothetical protein